jgi:hypothetical protein
VSGAVPSGFVPVSSAQGKMACSAPDPVCQLNYPRRLCSSTQDASEGGSNQGEVLRVAKFGSGEQGRGGFGRKNGSSVTRKWLPGSPSPLLCDLG